MSNVQISWQVSEPTTESLPTLHVSIAGTEQGSDVGSVSATMGVVVAPPASNAVLVSWVTTEAVDGGTGTPSLTINVIAQEAGRDTASVVLKPRGKMSIAALEAGRDTALVVVGAELPTLTISVTAREAGSDTGAVVLDLQDLPESPALWMAVTAMESGSDVAHVSLGLVIRSTEPSLEVAHYPITSYGKEILAVFERQPGEIKDFDISFADYLFAHRDTARSFTPIELQVPAELHLLEKRWIAQSGYLKVWVAGMQDRRSYKITAWLNTEGGRRLEADVMVVVREA